MKRTANLALTLALLGAIVIVVMYVWDRYMYTPWTRDGRVRAEVINIAPDVSGWIKDMHARNAQHVDEGDLLFTVDDARYQVAYELAEARMNSAKIAWERSTNVYQRRSRLKKGAVSREEIDSARLDMLESEAAYTQAQAACNNARLDLERTVYRAPASGKITNLELEKGDYVTRGSSQLALVKDSSYYVTGYFEETKIPAIRPGDQVDIWLMAGTVKLQGQVESIDSGISNTNTTPGNQMLPSVEATFAWVRLAQRIPVNIRIDDIPDDLSLSVGMSATVKVNPSPDQERDQRSVMHAWGENLRTLF